MTDDNTHSGPNSRDGIGPEVSNAVRTVFEAVRAPIRFVEHQAGKTALNRGYRDLLPGETLDAIREHHLALKGPCATPIGGGFRSVNVALRQDLNLYASLRPVRSLPGVKTRYEDVDLIIVRENTEGLYGGLENVITDGVVVAMKVATRSACQRIAAWTLDYAKRNQRRKISAFHKANIMKLTDGMLLEEARKVPAQGVEYEEVIIDAAVMRLVQDPTRFDVIMCENLYGDIISDLRRRAILADHWARESSPRRSFSTSRARASSWSSKSAFPVALLHPRDTVALF